MAHALPTEAGAGGDMARQLARLVGPAVQAPDDSVAGVEYLGHGTLLAAARQRTLDTVAEATPHRATDLLEEWERVLALAVRSSESTSARRAAVVARLRAVGGAPTRVARALAALAEEVQIQEHPHTDFPVGRTRKTMRLRVLVSATTHTDPVLRALLDELLDLLLPSHCTWSVQTTEVFTFGEPYGFDFAGMG